MTILETTLVVLGYVGILTIVVWNIIMRDDDFPKENDK
jgi:hypothetical protein